MKKLVILAVGAILLLGVVAVVAVLIASDGAEPARRRPAPGQPAAGGDPASAPLGSAARPGRSGYPPGPRRVQLPAGRVKAVLSEPLVPCFQSFPPHSSLPAVLTLELEAQSSGGFAVLGSSVKSWGGATAALVECVRKILPGQVVPGGSFTMGDRALYDFELSMPPVDRAAPAARASPVLAPCEPGAAAVEARREPLIAPPLAGSPLRPRGADRGRSAPGQRVGRGRSAVFPLWDQAFLPRLPASSESLIDSAILPNSTSRLHHPLITGHEAILVKCLDPMSTAIRRANRSPI